MKVIKNLHKSDTYKYAVFSTVFFATLISQETHIINIVGEDWNSIVQVFAVMMNGYAIMWNRDRTTKPLEEL